VMYFPGPFAVVTGHEKQKTILLVQT